MHGIAIYNVLRGVPYRLITHNVGNVDSIGSVIYLASDERRACSHSTFMFHGAGYRAPDQVFDVKRATEQLNSLKADQKRIDDIVLLRSAVGQRELSGFHRNQKTLTAAEAQTRGIVASIVDVVIPTGANVVTVIAN